MPAVAEALCGLAIGLVGALLHLWLLRRSLERASGMLPDAAGRAMARGVPARLLILSPLLFAVAKIGGMACFGFVAGFLLGRWAVGYLRIGSGSDRFAVPDR